MLHNIDRAPRGVTENSTALDPGVESNSRSPALKLGDILVDAGKLSRRELKRGLRMQDKKTSHFMHWRHSQSKQRLRLGEALVKLKLVTEEDLRYALASQFSYPCLPEKSEAGFSKELVTVYKPFSSEAEAFRALRSQLLLRWFNNESRSLTIVSPDSQEGRSYVSANLAVVFSQMGKRTLLVDADFRNPRQDAIFNLSLSHGLSSTLGALCNQKDGTKVPFLGDLIIVAAGAVPPNPLELLCKAEFDEWLGKMSSLYDVIIIDTPAAASYTDSTIIAARSGGALMVTRKDQTSFARTQDLASGLTSAGVEIIGAILNRF